MALQRLMTRSVMATAASLAAAPTATARARAHGLGWKRNAMSFAVPRRRLGASSRATATTAALPSLTSESTWRLQFDFFSGRDPNATEPDRTVSAKVKFALDEGYEPPQGVVEILEDDENVFADVRRDAATGVQMNNRWTLEEDPNERKAGLWIWGLFSEPLYPYLLFSMDVNRVEVAPGGYHVPAGKVFAEMRHARGSKQGCVLSDGTLSFKVTKTYQADLVGLSEVAVGEPNKCGRIKAECVA